MTQTNLQLIEDNDRLKAENKNLKRDIDNKVDEIKRLYAGNADLLHKWKSKEKEAIDSHMKLDDALDEIKSLRIKLAEAKS